MEGDKIQETLRRQFQYEARRQRPSKNMLQQCAINHNSTTNFLCTGKRGAPLLLFAIGFSGQLVVEPPKSRPYWVPEETVNACMRCGDKFTLYRGRCHCHSCGKIFDKKVINLNYDSSRIH